MAENLNVDLKSEWNADRCPIVNGIIYGDGRVARMEVEWINSPSGRLVLSTRPAGWTSLTELSANAALQWTGVITLGTSTDVARNLHLVCGEGSWGSDGFVAALRSNGKEILWIAFFTQSNPFEFVQLVEDQVMARTNLGTWWRFPLHCPEAVTVQ